MIFIKNSALQGLMFWSRLCLFLDILIFFQAAQFEEKMNNKFDKL